MTFGTYHSVEIRKREYLFDFVSARIVRRRLVVLRVSLCSFSPPGGSADSLTRQLVRGHAPDSYIFDVYKRKAFAEI